MGDDIPDFIGRKSILTCDMKSNDSIINATVEVRKLCAGNNVVAVDNILVVKLNETARSAIFAISDKAHIVIE
ncbi:MAG: hypothetical protein IJ597_07835, partial [Synergistaceae bacterium]|nr:hypothetical protein [Synergistaceae bacterium]